VRTAFLDTADEAVADVADGATVLVGGFGLAGMPIALIDALIRQGASDLTIVNNNAGNGDTGLAALLAKGRVRKVICSFPRQHDSWVFDDLYRRGAIELELVPQGNLAERMRAAGAGIGAFFCPTGVGTPLAEGKETREIDGRTYVLEYPIRGDVALVGALRADRAGNLVYRKTARNFGPVMATAAETVVAEVREIVDIGGIDPETVVTPGIFVDRIVCTTTHFDPAVLRQILMAVGRTTEQTGRAVREGGPSGLPPDLIAMKVAALLRDGEYVNLGIGLPTMVSNFLAGRDVILHAENGMLGYGGFPPEGEEDIDLYNASGQLVTALPGSAYFDSTVSFGMARTGRVSSVVLGAFQVAANGDLANWNIPGQTGGGIGGAMDLAAGGARLIAVCYQLERNGRSKLVERLTYPPTALGCVRSVVTDLAWIDVDADGFLLRELAPGLTVDDVRAATGAPLRVANDVGEMTFG